jgi:hypothetical protein
MKAKKSSR